MEASPHCSVRLECVMHAASVHPEPGSNSRQFSIITSLSARHNLKPEFPFASFEFSRFSSCVLKELSRFLLSRCSIFKDRFAVLALSRFRTFRVPSFSTSRAPSPDSLTILPHLLYFCQVLFLFFFAFFVFCFFRGLVMCLKPFFQHLSLSELEFSAQGSKHKMSELIT